PSTVLPSAVPPAPRYSHSPPTESFVGWVALTTPFLHTSLPGSIVALVLGETTGVGVRLTILPLVSFRLKKSAVRTSAGAVVSSPEIFDNVTVSCDPETWKIARADNRCPVTGLAAVTISVLQVAVAVTQGVIGNARPSAGTDTQASATIKF